MGAAMSSRDRNSSAWGGWIVFAAIMLLLIGVLTAMQGLAALLDDAYYVVTERDLLIFDFTAWGWIMLVIGAGMALTGAGLYRGSSWARWTAIAVVALNLVAQVGFLSAFPVWTLLVVALDVVVIFALTARWDEAMRDLELG
jgi:hypothetical protein